MAQSPGCDHGCAQGDDNGKPMLEIVVINPRL
jgi:hypothetical protein